MKYFNFSGSMLGEENTIEVCALKIYHLYQSLGMSDDIFKKIQIIISDKKTIDIDVFQSNEFDNIQIISDAIIQSNLSDINKYDKVKFPTKEYKRNYGFSCFVICGNDDIRIHHILGNSNYNIFNTAMNQKINRDFDWCFNILKIFVKKLLPLEASIKLSGNTYLQKTIKYRVPIGWVNYFSNKFDLAIPDGLDGFEYDYSDNGKYLISSREDFTISKELYNKQIDRMLILMEHLGEVVPGYIKEKYVSMCHKLICIFNIVNLLIIENLKFKIISTIY